MPNAYVSIDDLKSLLAITGASNDALLRSEVETASRVVDGYTRRHFFELLETKYFDVEAKDSKVLMYRTNDYFVVDPYGRLLGILSIEVPDLISITTLKDDEDQDGTFEHTWAATDYKLGPFNANPLGASDNARPYMKIEVSKLSNGTKSAFPTGQRSVEVDGKWGYWRKLQRATETVKTGGWTAAATAIEVSSRTDVKAGHTLLVGTEQIYVKSYAASILTVNRGVNGTTAAIQAQGTAIDIYLYPSQIKDATFLQASRLWHRKDSSIVEEIGLLETGQTSVQRGIDIEAQLLLRQFINRRKMLVL